MSETDFLTDLIEEIIQQGYDHKTTGRYAVLIGDTPILDDKGNIIVMDETGNIVATLKPLKMFDEI